VALQAILFLTPVSNQHRFTSREFPPQLMKGPFRVADARQAGLDWIDLQGSDWRRVGPGQYASTDIPATPELTLAAVLQRLPSTAAFSGRTAAWLHGLDVPPCDPIEVTVPVGEGVSTRAGVRVYRERLPANDVVNRRKLPATSMVRTVVDVSRRLDVVSAVIITDMALRASKVDFDQLGECERDRRGRKGVVRFRKVLRLADTGAESPMETRLRLLLVLAGLPRPTVNARLEDNRGRFLGRVDLYYPTHQVAIEYDGSTHRDSLVEDDRRQNRLLSAGIHLLRFTAPDLLNTPRAVVDQVRAALTRTRPAAIR
jgi:hypothetical protein